MPYYGSQIRPLPKSFTGRVGRTLVKEDDTLVIFDLWGTGSRNPELQCIMQQGTENVNIDSGKERQH